MDRTDEFLHRIKSLVEEIHAEDVYLDYPKVITELDFLMKVKAIKARKSLADAARSINIKRTTLHEYIKNKLCMTKEQVREIDLEQWPS
jgi:hypothetical protein